jgi:hypothetical protein
MKYQIITDILKTLDDYNPEAGSSPEIMDLIEKLAEAVEKDIEEIQNYTDPKEDALNEIFGESMKGFDALSIYK